MLLNEYQTKALRTQADQEEILKRLSFVLLGPGMQLIDGIIGLADEVGEISSCIKKHVEYKQPLDRVNLKEEVGDCLWRLSQICDAADLTLEECALSNIEKLQLRYPDKYSDHLAAEVNRDRDAEREVILSGRAIRVGQGITQTGAGWAEPPEDVL